MLVSQPPPDDLYGVFQRYGSIADCWYDDTPADSPRILFAIDSPSGRSDDPYLKELASDHGSQFSIFGGSVATVAGQPATERGLTGPSSSLYVLRNKLGQTRMLFARVPTWRERLAHLVGAGPRCGG